MYPKQNIRLHCVPLMAQSTTLFSAWLPLICSQFDENVRPGLNCSEILWIFIDIFYIQNDRILREFFLFNFTIFDIRIVS
ncbi:hypothetical protein FHS21_001434 [Phyllobacterium trifolii]|uniref:Uncharacterized protein n=1 Tax=Phyllobacterium trifolii TaxID=300193 RepID=A0A839U525_9HYPH|nr:hypothetical protein [Phyllobacterium trifolii]